MVTKVPRQQNTVISKATHHFDHNLIHLNTNY